LRDLRTLAARLHSLPTIGVADADDCLEDGVLSVNDAINAVRNSLQLQEDWENDRKWRRPDEMDARNDALRYD
jgi:hypothetical protein